MYGVQLTTICHQSSYLGSKSPKSMARNRTWDLRDLGAFLWSSKRATLIPAPLPCELFSLIQKGCNRSHDVRNAVLLYYGLP